MYIGIGNHLAYKRTHFYPTEHELILNDIKEMTKPKPARKSIPHSSHVSFEELNSERNLK